MILDKNGKLTKDEFENVKRHTKSGYRIAKAIPEIAHIADFILHHHERWDGKGYPDGLKNKDIPLIARILHILDAYDAMTNDQPYRKALNKREVISEFVNNSETQFDPELIDIFVNKILIDKTPNT
jgi:HD-GYP domain-containing protein (c-di-GMP phosphodiesterase class II)